MPFLRKKQKNFLDQSIETFLAESVEKYMRNYPGVIHGSIAEEIPSGILQKMSGEDLKELRDLKQRNEGT